MEYLLKASVIIAIFYVCYKLFLQRETFFESNRWFLLVGLTISFTIPFIVIPIYITVEPSQLQNIIVSNEINPTVITEKPFDILQFVIFLYLAGVIFFLGQFIIQIGSLGILLFNHNKSKNGRYTFIKTKSNASPFSFFNWIVYNPNQFSENELKQIITHEKVHARQYHSIDIILTQLSSIVFWFNPFIWLYKKELQQNLEFIADQNTQAKSDCNKTYQHLLLKTSVPNYQMALTNNFYNSLIKKRIIMLHKNRSKNKNQWKYALIIPVLALFLMSFNTKEIIKYDEYVSSNNSISTYSDETGDIEMALITKDFSDADFDKLKKEFAEKGITLKFKGIKRNNGGEITALKIDVSSKKTSANYSTDSDEPIEPIKITFDSENNSISIGNHSEMHFGEGYSFKTKERSHNIHKTGKGSSVSFHSNEHEDNDEHEYEIIKDDSKIFIKKGGNVHDIKKIHKSKGVYTILGDDGEVIELKGKSDKNGNIMFIRKDKKGNVVKEWIEEDSDNIWIEEDGGKINIKSFGENNNKFFFSTDSGKNPLFILDGKEVSKKIIDDLDAKKIESVNVIKGTAATEKYGKKGKDGVVVITTKKE